MSTNLHWLPITDDRGKTLSKDLKFKMLKSERYERALNGGLIILDSGHIPFFEGLMAAEVEDADKIIEAIEKHSKIKVWLE